MNTSKNMGKWLLSLPLVAAALAPMSASAQETVPPAATSGLDKLVLQIVGGQTVTPDHWVTVAFIAIGIVLAVLYLRGMYLVLHYASVTYDISLDDVDDAAYRQSSERNLLVIGSFLLVALSAGIIWAYGANWLLLYIGPVLSLLGPVVIIASMEIDIQKYRSAIRANQANAGLPLQKPI